MLAIDTETTGLFIHKGCRAFCISAACDQDNTYLWKFKVDPFTREVYYDPDRLQDFQDTLSKHEDLIFHNANFDIQALDALGVSIDHLFNNHSIHDTMVMSHAYKSNGTHGLKELGVTLLSYPEDDEKRLVDITIAARKEAKKLDWEIADKNNPHPHLKGLQKEWHKSDYWIPALLAETKKYPSNHEWHTICDTYAISDAIRTIGVYYILTELLTSKQKLAYNKARKLIQPILKMQNEKITLIPEEVSTAHKEYTLKAREQLHTIRSHLLHSSKVVQNNRYVRSSLAFDPREFNPRSTKQLPNVLFNHYKFKPPKIKDSGKPSTDKHVIDKLLEDCPTTKPIPPKFQFLLDLKKLRKFNTTIQYINNYDTHRSVDYELQPFFKQTGTGTNRLACENPNTTNVGSANMEEEDEHVIDEEEKSFRLRNIFGPRQGETWTCIDFQQFQLLIFAIVSGSTKLVDAYLAGMDLHQATAMEIFQTSNISKEQRRAAKNVNFGILFGAGPAKINQTAGIPGLYSTFLQRLPGAKQYLELQASTAAKKGYVHTLGGYRLYVPRDRSYAASCYVIQGTEAEIVRSAMVDTSNYTYSQTQNYIDQYNKSNRTLSHLTQAAIKSCPYKMIMMVHDELVFRSKRTDHTHIANLMTIMENAALRLGVPAKVDADIVVANWADKYSYKGPCPVCKQGALVQWKNEDSQYTYTYQDCIKCNLPEIGLTY